MLNNGACFGALALFALLFALPRNAQAIPIFAQRYHLQCSACHSVLPELNTFGNYFRSHGYRLPGEKHGTTGVALRYQLEYERDPAPNTRRFSPAGVLLSNADIGAISAFVHYNLGAGGGPAGLFLGYLSTYNAHTASVYRAGLIELPLAQSPGQRLDDLAQYGYYGTRVGLNDLSLASPRWGIQMQRAVGSTLVDVVLDDGEYKGSAYGGKPVATGVSTSPERPETAVFLRGPIAEHVIGGLSFVSGTRSIVPTGRAAFSDAYVRDGVLGRASFGRFDIQSEQWWGSDANADGFGSRVSSSGGYARFKYYPSPHWYLGLRYDAAANPVIVRDWTYYTAFHITRHARLLLQDVQTVGGRSAFGAALTVGAPWPPNE